MPSGRPAAPRVPATGRRVLVIANPAAGGRRGSARRLARVIAEIEQRGCPVVVRHAGTDAGDAERLAREVEPGFDVIVAAGGDGTVNAVANGLAGTTRPLAVLPFGTANVLAHELGLPRQPADLAALIATGTPRRVWPGIVGDRLFLTTASAGFDAAVVAAVQPKLKRRLGRVAFACAIVAQWRRHRWCDLEVRIDGTGHIAATVIAAKGRCYAGRFAIAPQADLAAPRLVFIMFRRAGRIAVLRYLLALLRGRLAGRDDIIVAGGREAFIAGPKTLPVQADGEIVGRLPLRIGIAHQPLMLIG